MRIVMTPDLRKIHGNFETSQAPVHIAAFICVDFSDPKILEGLIKMLLQI